MHHRSLDKVEEPSRTFIQVRPAYAEQPRDVLIGVGYEADRIEDSYPVWLGSSNVSLAELVAFGGRGPKNMSTAGVVAGVDIGSTFQIASALAAPYLLVANSDGVDIWLTEENQPTRWRTDVRSSDIHELSQWIGPTAALKAKIGLRQRPLPGMSMPVNLLASARAKGVERLAPMVEEAFEAAYDALAPSQGATPNMDQKLIHRRSARLVVGALTVLAIRDQNGADDGVQSTASAIAAAVESNGSTFDWLKKALGVDKRVFRSLVDKMGDGINYQSLDPTILSHVYEEALVDADDRKRLGIYYTPPELANRLLNDLPVELVPPEERHVLDPTCGSGTLLVAAHDRLRDLQPASWTDDDRHGDLAVHLRGFDIDPFASEIARLTLLLHAQPAGNGWLVEGDVDTLEQGIPSRRPHIIVSNPPWAFDGIAKRTQVADRFLRWSMDALAPGGLLGILLPGSWLSSDHSKSTRREMSQHFDLFEIWNLPEGTFRRSGSTACALFAQKRFKSDGIGRNRLIRRVRVNDLDAFVHGAPASVQYQKVGGITNNAATPPPIAGEAPTERLDKFALILSGPQPKSEVARRSSGIKFLKKFSGVPSYGSVASADLWSLSFPEDFQGARGRKVISKKKILASATRNPNNAWRFKVAIDLVGVAMTNGIRGIAPLNQDDEDLLYALLILVGSGFASYYAASQGGDRNIPARVLQSMPIPTSRRSLRRLAKIGRRALALSDDPHALGPYLAKAESDVWASYGAAPGDIDLASRWLADDRPPGGFARYPPPVAEELLPPGRRKRRLGAVLDAADGRVLIWINGLTPDEGVEVPVPRGMGGWFIREGATFDVTGVDDVSQIAGGTYRLQPFAWSNQMLETSAELV